MNPFDTSLEPSFDEEVVDDAFNSSMPICYEDTNPLITIKNSYSMTYHPYRETKLSSPIEKIDIDAISEKFSQQDHNDQIKEMQLGFRQLKCYSEALEKRSVEMAMELEKEKHKNQQLLTAFTFIKDEEANHSKNIEDKNIQIRNLEKQLVEQTDKNEVLQMEQKNIKSENAYLKELIMLANENYEKLQQKLNQISNKNVVLQREKDEREEEMIKKMSQIKDIFTKLIVDKNENNLPLKERKKDENTMAVTTVNNFQSTKPTTKKEVDEAYRQMFMKTLKQKKQNAKA